MNVNTRTWAVSGGAVTLALTLSTIVLAQPPAMTPNGEQVFNARCKMCHDPAQDRAPGRAELAIHSRTDIVAALATGVMQPMARGLSPAEMEAVAVFLTSSTQSAQPAAPANAPTPAAQPARAAAPAVGVDQMCATHPPIRATASDWSTVGVDDASSRFQKNPGLKAADVPKLKLKWAFAMSGGGQPTVVGDWLFMANRSGKFYALDAKTGCVHWAVEGAGSRTTPMVIQSAISPSGWATFLGVGGRVVRAFDAQTGKEIWRSATLDAKPVAGITGSPIVHGDQIFVPITSSEEPAAIQPTYACCSFRGSLVALDLKTGKTNWQTFMVTEPLRNTQINSAGVQMQGPAGGAIWAAPTVDAKRGLIYVVTGDSYTEVDTKGADAIVAMDMKTGQIRWSNQVTPGDNYIMGCTGPTKSPNCPDPLGPDHDFGASPILFSLSGGKQILIAGQKSGEVYGLDPDTGKTIWEARVGLGSALGGVEWGIGADSRYVFVPNADFSQVVDEALHAAGKPREGELVIGKPGLTALNPANGKTVWHVAAPKAACKYAGDRSRDYAQGECVRAQSAAPGVMPGIVFSGTLDGWFRAYDAATGKIVWSYSTTAQTYDTVNGVKAQPGGGIDGMGPTIASGMVYTMSGFNGASRTGGNGTNVLLAFSVDGR